MSDAEPSSPAVEVVARLRSSFRKRTSFPLDWRLRQLAKLKKCMVENHKKWCVALYQDLRKPEEESKLTELAMVFSELDLFAAKLKKWAKPTPVEKPSLLLHGLDTLRMTPNPHGVVLIISPWNYPVQLSVVALIGAIGAGNCVVLKPSEHAPATASLFAELLPKYLDPNCFAVYNGGIPETTALLEQRFDHIMYTGSTAVGKVIMRAAAEHLTPVTLELGGKSPVIVDGSADAYLAARRICWGKFMNAGQSCIAPDYVMVEDGSEERLLAACKKVIGEMFGESTQEQQQSSSYGRIVSQRHWTRLAALLDQSDVHYGGGRDEADLFIAPTIVTNVTGEHPLMQDELFGPILPVMIVKNIREAVQFVNSRPKPLAIYLFSNLKAPANEVERYTASGAFVLNDTMIHASMHTLPFGGVGASGIGGYHGKHSFDTFSHLKPVVHKTTRFERANNMRMAPYEEEQIGRLLWLLSYPKELIPPCMTPQDRVVPSGPPPASSATSPPAATSAAATSGASVASAPSSPSSSESSAIMNLHDGDDDHSSSSSTT
eukprot:TRINITY_DN2996_c0_g1_i1.p1 TRINITY_DN2996_c0_g1~~TRINITY_DN2996_c0_g1_i1.p1  ORF type:complete len:547 (+),score=124.17 TRINITY_DN2996_c0_g1_i1:74-1714(+)